MIFGQQYPSSSMSTAFITKPKKVAKTVSITNMGSDRDYFLHQPKLPRSYKKILTKYPLNDLLELSKNDRCNLYFNELAPDWTLPLFKDDLKYSADIYEPREFFRVAHNKLKNLNPELDFDSMVDSIFSDFNSKTELNDDIETQLLEGVYKFRTYLSCYIGNEENTLCNQIDPKIFSWFTFKSPVYERWDGKIVDSFVNMRPFYPDQTYKSLLHYDQNICFWTKFQKEMYGKGIVLSISDRFVPDLINLIKLFRFFKNEYPIQFVHKGDLSDASKKQLTEVAREDITLHGVQTINEHKQDIWFVNTRGCISDGYQPYFNSFANKWLAVLFNTFEEMMLMDTDVAPFVSPEYFFNLAQYKSKGAFFFKDRVGIDSIKPQIPKMWLEMFPSIIETTLFETPQTSNITLNNDFFSKGSRHMMEAGVVLINRKTHLSGLLLSTQIQLWQPLTVKIHGEKEIFWLGQSMMGNEEYEFNNKYSGAAGMIVEDTYEKANLVISALPLHLDPNDHRTILWLNSGLTYCKKNSWEKDAEEIFKDQFTVEELKAKYQSTININLMIVPPEVWKQRDPNSNKFDPQLKEPNYSWMLRWDLGCSGYLWSAHSEVDGVKGLEVRYNEQEIQHFNEVALVWAAKIH